MPNLYNVYELNGWAIIWMWCEAGTATHQQQTHIGGWNWLESLHQHLIIPSIIANGKFRSRAMPTRACTNSHPIACLSLSARARSKLIHLKKFVSFGVTLLSFPLSYFHFDEQGSDTGNLHPRGPSGKCVSLSFLEWNLLSSSFKLCHRRLPVDENWLARECLEWRPTLDRHQTLWPIY